MDSVFRSAKEKLEREHRERKENGKLKVEREKKAKDAAERQREAIEASQRERRLESIEAQTKVEDNLGERKEEDLKHRGGDSSLKVKVSPRLMLEKLMKRAEERRGGMRQEAKVEGGSDKQSKEEYFNDDEDVEWDDDEDVEWDDDEDVEGKEDLKAKGGDYTSLKVDGGFKDSKDEYLKAYYYALLNQRGVAKAEEGKASAAANGNCKRWT